MGVFGTIPLNLYLSPAEIRDGLSVLKHGRIAIHTGAEAEQEARALIDLIRENSRE